jgi:hypothetical protein
LPGTGQSTSIGAAARRSPKGTIGAEKRALAWRTSRTVPSGVKASIVVGAGWVVGAPGALGAAGALCAHAACPPHRPSKYTAPSILSKLAARISSPPVRSQTSLAILNIPVNNISIENAGAMHAPGEWL